MNALDLKMIELIKTGKTVKKCKVISAREPNHERRIVFFEWPHNGKTYDQWAVVKLYRGWAQASIVKICATRRSAGYHWGRR